MKLLRKISYNILSENALRRMSSKTQQQIWKIENSKLPKFIRETFVSNLIDKGNDLANILWKRFPIKGPVHREHGWYLNGK